MTIDIIIISPRSLRFSWFVVSHNKQQRDTAKEKKREKQLNENDKKKISNKWKIQLNKNNNNSNNIAC